jgi:hypothetical protein
MVSAVSGIEAQTKQGCQGHVTHCPVAAYNDETSNSLTGPCRAA